MLREGGLRLNNASSSKPDAQGVRRSPRTVPLSANNGIPGYCALTHWQQRKKCRDVTMHALPKDLFSISRGSRSRGVREYAHERIPQRFEKS